MHNDGYAGELTPRQAWEMLDQEPSSMLIDVRTRAEWTYVGIADLSRLAKQPVLISWQLFPDMQLNPEFARQLAESGAGSDTPLLFICRSAIRSKEAAIAMTSLGFERCYNVSQGFEGDPDGAKHRGKVSGWKVEGLPWVQS